MQVEQEDATWMDGTGNTTDGINRNVLGDCAGDNQRTDRGEGQRWFQLESRK